MEVPKSLLNKCEVKKKETKTDLLSSFLATSKSRVSDYNNLICCFTYKFFVKYQQANSLPGNYSTAQQVSISWSFIIILLPMNNGWA